MANIRVAKKYDLENDNEENKTEIFLKEFDNFIVILPQLSTFSRTCVGYIAGCEKIN